MEQMEEQEEDSNINISESQILKSKETRGKNPKKKKVKEHDNMDTISNIPLSVSEEKLHSIITEFGNCEVIESK